MGELLVDRPADGVIRLARCLVLTGTGDMFSSGYDLDGPPAAPGDEAGVAAAAERLDVLGGTA